MSIHDNQVLLPQHAQLLLDSGITPAVAQARGYQSVTTKAALKRLGFTESQCLVPALLIPSWGLTGEVALYQARPDTPRLRQGKLVKYETPPGTQMALDVPPSARPWLGDPGRPLFITEGARKADAGVSQGLCTIDLLGVWNWRGTNVYGGKVALPDWESVALNGRPTYIVFDSDVMAKVEVYAALARLKPFLEQRGAQVQVVYLPPGVGGTKVGLDDYFVAGHSLQELMALATPELLAPPLEQEEDAGTPYQETAHGLVWLRPTKNGEVPTPLTNFSARIVGDVLEDDGAEVRRRFEIEAQLHGQTVRFTIPVADFPGMQWATAQLGARALVFPGFGLRDHARTAVQMLSGAIVERRVYGHTGWREHRGAWVYLHAAGAVGADGAVEGVEVSLSGTLTRFELPAPPTGATLIEAIRANLALFDVAPLTVTAPVQAATYLAPLQEPLAHEPPDFTLWLHGASGSFKTELAALAQAHFGPFTRLTLPGTFLASANAIERLAFGAKDALLVIDDYYPASQRREAEAMAQVASRVLRTMGNHQSRQRMKPDTTLRPDLPPRCLIVATGEHVPEGHSTAARIFPVPMAPGDVDVEKLSAAQAQRPLLAEAMAGYVQWIARHFEAIQRTLPIRFQELRALAQQTGGHRREPGQVAHLYLGLETWLTFAVASGAWTEEAKARLLKDAWPVLLAIAREHPQELSAETPVERFLALLGDGFASKRVYVTAPHGGPPEDAEALGWERDTSTAYDGMGYGEWRHGATATLLGVCDGDHLLLYPEVTFQVVTSAARMAGQVFPVELKTLLKRLDEAQLIMTDAKGRRHTVNVRLGRKTQRVIKLLRQALFPSPSPDYGEQREHRDLIAGNGTPAVPARSPTPPHASAMGNDGDVASKGETGNRSAVPPVARNGEEKGRRCGGCGMAKFWRSIHGVIVCGVCHPPAREALVDVWLSGNSSDDRPDGRQ
jgi:hypothetical protein